MTLEMRPAGLTAAELARAGRFRVKLDSLLLDIAGTPWLWAADGSGGSRKVRLQTVDPDRVLVELTADEFLAVGDEEIVRRVWHAINS